MCICLNGIIVEHCYTIYDKVVAYRLSDFVFSVVNPLTLTAAKRGLLILEKFYLQKHFEDSEMLFRNQATTLLQIFWESLLCSQVIFKSMKVADDTF